MNRTYLIGTRGSRLALFQAEKVRGLLREPAELRTIRTSGDVIRGELGAGGSDTGFFTREIQKKLLEGEVDMAVHSLKDLPTTTPPGLRLAALLERDFAADILIAAPGLVKGQGAGTLGPGMRVGTSSLRRRALCAAFMPSASTVPMRGNVDTRMAKLRRGDCDALLLSRAGVERLGAGLDGLEAFEMNPRLWLPSAGQGVIAVEVREDDGDALALCAGLDHEATRTAVTIERDLMRRAGGGCHAPFGVLAEPLEQGNWAVTAGETDGRGQWRAARAEGEPSEVAAAALHALRSGGGAYGERDAGPLLRPLF
jgi:hydroxymethylbilane synthase